MCPNRFPNYLCAKNDATLSYSFSLVLVAQPEGVGNSSLIIVCCPWPIYDPKQYFSTLTKRSFLHHQANFRQLLSSIRRFYTISQLQIPPTLSQTASLSLLQELCPCPQNKTQHFTHLHTLKGLENGLYMSYVCVYIHTYGKYYILKAPYTRDREKMGWGWINSQISGSSEEIKRINSFEQP